ncbi:MAG: GNAT family N-acetyltransferase [Azoarcus sp.]|nr:GNAT family N-acetyltransferase [Azoarcus sp.]
MTQDLRISTMSRNELDIAIDWAAAEGWNPGLHDRDSYYAADPEGFLIGRVGDEPVATISVVRYGEGFGFLGFYIVHPEHRGRGHGLALWRAGMQRLDGRTVGLDGVPAQQPNYRKSGFELAWRNVRYEGEGGGEKVDAARIVPLSMLPFEALAAYERPYFPAPRTDFLRGWIGQPDALSLGCVDNGRLTGYGVIRPCRNGHKIAPLYADSPEVAETLFSALASRVAPGTPVFLDIPETNPEALALVARHGMHPQFETARMYAGPAPTLPVERIYGMTSFEIG